MEEKGGKEGGLSIAKIKSHKGATVPAGTNRYEYEYPFFSISKDSCRFVLFFLDIMGVRVILLGV